MCYLSTAIEPSIPFTSINQNNIGSVLRPRVISTYVHAMQSADDLNEAGVVLRTNWARRPGSGIKIVSPRISLRFSFHQYILKHVYSHHRDTSIWEGDGRGLSYQGEGVHSDPFDFKRRPRKLLARSLFISC